MQSNANLTPPNQPLTAPPIPHKALMLSRKVDEYKSLVCGLDECKPLP